MLKVLLVAQVPQAIKVFQVLLQTQEPQGHQVQGVLLDQRVQQVLQAQLWGPQVPQGQLVPLVIPAQCLDHKVVLDYLVPQVALVLQVQVDLAV